MDEQEQRIRDRQAIADLLSNADSLFTARGMQHAITRFPVVIALGDDDGGTGEGFGGEGGCQVTLLETLLAPPVRPSAT